MDNSKKRRMNSPRRPGQRRTQGSSPTVRPYRGERSGRRSTGGLLRATRPDGSAPFIPGFRSNPIERRKRGVNGQARDRGEETPAREARGRERSQEAKTPLEAITEAVEVFRYPDTKKRFPPLRNANTGHYGAFSGAVSPADGSICAAIASAECAGRCRVMVSMNGAVLSVGIGQRPG